MARNLRQEFLGIPNLLTLARIAVIPFVLLFMDRGAAEDATVGDRYFYSFLAALLFALAAATDWFDGWLARNMGWTSLLGKLLDPLADKLIVMAVLVKLAALDRVPAWLVVLLLAREFAITGLRSIASSEGLSIDVIQSGKWKTAFQLCGLIGLLLHYEYPIDFVVVSAPLKFHEAGMLLVVLSLAFSLLSAASYFRSFLRAIVARHRAPGAEDADRPDGAGPA
jgi:CDP-diacylglycerol--glycerol-3-phosphate 3-phosphatidyltransferase